MNKRVKNCKLCSAASLAGSLIVGMPYWTFCPRHRELQLSRRKT